ncbi:MAG: hypothetical protein GY940_29240 [bacterium]|nr:hypothetical protein [bacterium]
MIREMIRKVIREMIGNPLIINTLLLVLFVTFGSPALDAKIPLTEREALINFYTATNGDNWESNSGWKDGEISGDGFAPPGSEGNWQGITVFADHVTKISFIRNGLYGQLPEEIGNLPLLEILHLSEPEGLEGEIPIGIGKLERLRKLHLEGAFPGSLPSELGNLINLRELYLSGRFTDQLPTRLGNLINLEKLRLEGNFSGELPPALGELMKLWTLHLDGCFEGELPTELGKLGNLKTLNLNCHPPIDFSRYSSRRSDVRVRGKILDGQSEDWLGLLNGSLPPEIGQLNRLEKMTLFAPLTGTIPAELGNLSNLKVLHLWGEFTGSPPTELGDLDNLRDLSLAGNQLSGPIPPELGKLANLQYLQLQDNQFGDAIPEELGNLQQLKQLRLDGNQLSGPVPDQLSQLSGAYQVNIAYNSLYADGDTLREFLDSKDLGWKKAQTVPPTDIKAEPVSATSIKVSWTPIPYRTDRGTYMVYFSETPGGPWELAETTPSKASRSLVVTGLKRRQTYYFIIQTRTEPHRDNRNTLTSKYSFEVSATTPDRLP